MVRFVLLGLLALLPALPAEELRIALLATGSTTDGGWNQLAKEGLSAIAERHGAELTILERVTQDRAAGEMQQFAALGFQLVIAHGYEYLNPATEVAAETLNTRFVVSGADVARPNVITIDFDVSHPSYQAGVLAARISTKKSFGYIGGAPIPSVKACYRGFRAGVRSVLPDATVAETYTSWDQLAQNKAQAEALLRQGVDVIYHNVDAASRGIFEAIAAANRSSGPRSAWVIGCVADQNDYPICRDFILGSAAIRLDETFDRIVSAMRDGTSEPGLVQENLKRGTCAFIPNPRLIGEVITEAHLTELNAIGVKLAAGEIIIPSE